MNVPQAYVPAAAALQTDDKRCDATQSHNYFLLQDNWR